MTSFQDIYNRILCATNIRTQTELAAILEIRQSSISDAKRRDSIPADWYLKLYEKFRLNPEWLKQGSGPMFLRPDDTSPPLLAEAAPPPYADPLARAVIVPVYGMVFAYDGALPPPPPPVIGKIALPAAHAAEHIAVLSVESDSAAPTIRKGAQIGVNTASRLPVSGQLFALYVPYEGIAVKRIFSAPEQGGFILRSDAPGYPEAFLSPEACKARLFGQVAWTLQTL